MARLKDKYTEEIVPALKEKFQYNNIMEVPKLVKIVVNMGLGEAIANPKALDAAVGDMTQITGQKPIITKAKKSVAAFKVREGMSIGCKVTSSAILHRISIPAACTLSYRGSGLLLLLMIFNCIYKKLRVN